MSKRYNVHLGEAVCHLGHGQTVRFRPQGNVVHHNYDAAEEATVKRYGSGGYAARLLVGLNVGKKAKYTVDDIVEAVIEIRKEQKAEPDASILSQRGIYTDKKEGIVVENSVQIVIIDLASLTKKEFVEQTLSLAEELQDRFRQKLVVVEIQKRGVVTDVYGVTP